MILHVILCFAAAAAIVAGVVMAFMRAAAREHQELRLRLGRRQNHRDMIV